MKRIALLGFGVGMYLASHTAGAVSLIDHSAGLKLTAGADIWSTPTNVPIGFQNGAGFVGSAGGFGYGVMPYYELRIIKLVGVEADINYQHGSFHRNISLNSTDNTETITMNSWRLPILAKLNIPLGLGRLWFGLGPEFTLAQSSSEKSEGPNIQSYATKDVKPTFFTGGLGLVIELPLTGIEIPVEFRASKNLSQPSNYVDRVDTNPPALHAESSWVYRLGVGLGVQF